MQTPMTHADAFTPGIIKEVAPCATAQTDAELGRAYDAFCSVFRSIAYDIYIYIYLSLYIYIVYIYIHTYIYI